MTRAELEAMAHYLTSSTHTDLRGELTAYLRAPADKKEEILLRLWDKYGDRVKATMGRD